MLAISITTTTKARSWVHGRRTTTRTNLTRRCAFTSAVENSRLLRVTFLLTIVVLVSVPAGAQRRAPPRVAYSNFSHTTHVTKEKLACASCHKFPTKNWKTVRKGDAAFPDVAEFPEHDTCLKCHRQQFFARERPAPQICANCHVKGTPADTSRYPFPSL